MPANQIVSYRINTLQGLTGEPGIAYDYLLAGNGVFVRGKNAHLAVTVCIAPAEVRGLVPLEEDVQLLHGRIPMYLLHLAISTLCVRSDREQYLAVVWQDGYSLRIRAQTGTGASVTYETVPDTVLDIHSHVGGISAHFSGIDDHDEQGLGLYAVVGDTQNLCPTVELRVGAYGYFAPMEMADVFA